MSFLKKTNEHGIISGFCGVCTVLETTHCVLWSSMPTDTFELKRRGKPVGTVHAPVYRRLDIANKWLTCYMFQNRSPTLTISSHKDPALERNTWDSADGLCVPFFLFCLRRWKACWSATRSAMSGLSALWLQDLAGFIKWHAHGLDDM